MRYGVEYLINGNLNFEIWSLRVLIEELAAGEIKILTAELIESTK